VTCRIKLLPPELVNKIAAGEVVERPASVVKELVENSLDAGADRIEVSFEAGGLGSILVRDNGQGMAPDEARLSLKRHATSKISDETDLFRVASLGFRGEALPAVASVSRLTLTTRPVEASAATRVILEGGRLVSVEEIGAPPGTSVEVRDLFFNTPARLKFLKSDRTESSWIKEAFIRLALARPQVFFRLSETGQALLNLAPAAGAGDRLVELLGPEVGQGLIPIEHDHPAVRVSGLVSSPETTRANSRSIFGYVNGRHVRDRVILAGIMAGYEGRLVKGRFPVALVFLDLEPGTVDVNVHPAKLEVRFRHAGAIHLALKQAVSGALRAEERFIWSLAEPGQGQAGPEPRLAESRPSFGRPERSAFEPGRSGIREPAPLPVDRPEPSLSHDRLDFRFLGLYAGLYLVGQSGPDLVLIDQHAAHERILFEQLKASPGQSQPLLLPLNVTLTPLEAEVLAGSLEQLAKLGLAVEPFGPRGLSFVVKSLPAPLSGTDPAGLVQDLAAKLSGGRAGMEPEGLLAALARSACRQAIKAGQEMSPQEAASLLEALGRLSGPLTCPHGRPILRRLTRAEIDRGFRRQ